MKKREAQGLIIGGVVGALTGMAIAWLLLTRPQEPGREKQPVSWPEVLKLVVSLLRAVERVSHWL